MKWSLQQLFKIQSFPYSFSETLDFSEEIKKIDDIISISPVNITGRINRLDNDTYQFVYSIRANMVLQCALTLDPVDYLFEGNYDEVYSTIPNDDYYLIEKNSIDTKVMVWSNIIADKPINVTIDNAYEVLKERGIVLDDAPLIDDDDIISYSDGKYSEDESK